MSTPANSLTIRKKTPPLVIVLSLISALFIGILIFAYYETKRANPIFLDEHGKPVQQRSSSGHGSH